MSYSKPLPNKKGIAQAYWEGLKKEKLLIQECKECHHSIFYPRVVCTNCGGSELEYKEHSGVGEIYSYTVVYKPRNPEFKQDVPYVVALVQLEGGARMMTNIVDCEIEKIEIGMKVKIVFESVTEEITLPFFKPL